MNAPWRAGSDDPDSESTGPGSHGITHQEPLLPLNTAPLRKIMRYMQHAVDLYIQANTPQRDLARPAPAACRPGRPSRGPRPRHRAAEVPPPPPVPGPCGGPPPGAVAAAARQQSTTEPQQTAARLRLRQLPSPACASEYDHRLRARERGRGRGSGRWREGGRWRRECQGERGRG